VALVDLWVMVDADVVTSNERQGASSCLLGPFSVVFPNDFDDGVPVPLCQVDLLLLGSASGKLHQV